MVPFRTIFMVSSSGRYITFSTRVAALESPIEPVIDLHSHVIPAFLIEDARHGRAIDGLALERGEGDPWLIHRQGYRYPVPATFHDLEQRLAAMDAMGVRTIVASPSPTIFFYWTEASEARDIARAVNEDVARLQRDAAGRVFGLATLPMQDVDAAVAELRRSVTELGLRGATIGPVMEQTPLDDPSFTPLLAAAEELDVPLMLHPYYVGPRPGLGEFYLSNLVGNPLETTVSAARLILSGALDRHERLKVILLHGGGYLPYQVGRLDHGYRVRPESKRPAHPPSAYLRRFVFDTLTHAPAPLRLLVDLVGADRVAYGTDFPFDMGGPGLEAQLAGTGLTPDDREAIARGTAMDLLSIEPTDRVD